MFYTLETALNLLDRQTLEHGQVFYFVAWDTRLGALAQLRNAATTEAQGFGTFNSTAVAMKYMDPAAQQLNCHAHVIQWDNRFGKKLALPPKTLPKPLPSHQLEVRITPASADYFNVRIFNRKINWEVPAFRSTHTKDDAAKKAGHLSDLLNAPALWM